MRLRHKENGEFAYKPRSNPNHCRELVCAASLVLNALLIYAVYVLSEGNPIGILESRGESFPSDSMVTIDSAFAGLPDETEGVARRLGSNDTASSGSGGSSGSHGSSGGHSAHQHDAMLYLFNSIILGAAVMQLSAKFPVFQETVALFFLGFVFSLILKHSVLLDWLRVWGTSWKMWVAIDPHLLLFALLPALLAGDAMTIDTSVARRVGLQCLFLAGPGVVICGFATAGFLKLFLGWDFWLCLCSGAILCATDPVAVVALLKQLGASPMLTVQIQGESLLNDGTAIVLYLIAYNVLKGEHYAWEDVADFLIKKAIMAFALGLFIGYFFFTWIRLAANKLNHSSSMIQILLSFSCAYWSFAFVEGVLTLSGVLSTVAASLVLARHMWPHVVSPESMHHVWHTFESLGNIIIFFLAGSITGWTIGEIPAIDYLNLLVIYLFLTVLRMALIFACIPILGYLSLDRTPVHWKDALVMSWGGLRGAVGLAMAISVRNDLAPDMCTGLTTINEKDAQRLLFYVSGVALLTMGINATTAPVLVNKLGITAQPKARQTLLKMFHQQLVNWSEDANNPKEVTEALKKMLEEAEEEIDHQKWRRGNSFRGNEVSAFKGAAIHQENSAVIKELQDSKTRYEGLVKSAFPGHIENGEVKHMVLGLPLMSDATHRHEIDHLLGKCEDVCQLIDGNSVDIPMAKVVNQVFLNCLKTNYQKMVDAGDLLPGGPEAEVLFTSVVVALSPFRPDLVDYGYVHETMVLRADFSDQGEDDLANLGDESVAVAASKSKSDSTSGLGRCIASWQFGVTILVLILLNSIQVAAEEIFRQNCKETCGSTCEPKPIDDHWGWLVLDAFFTTAFTAECLLKLAWLRLKYFGDNWNRFDFVLVVLGIVGLIASASDHTSGGSVAGKSRIIRVARVLRTLRFLRILRLLNARWSRDKYVSLELARHLKKIGTLRCFAKGHLLAQNDLVKYFGGNGKIDDANELELGRCVLQSQIAVYSALADIVVTERELGKDTCAELAHLCLRKDITENLSKFILEANEDGALSETETHAILHPLNHEVAVCMQRLFDLTDGIVSKDRASTLSAKKYTMGLK